MSTRSHSSAWWTWKFYYHRHGRAMHRAIKKHQERLAKQRFQMSPDEIQEYYNHVMNAASSNLNYIYGGNGNYFGLTIIDDLN